MLPKDRRAHTLSAGETQQSQTGVQYDLMNGKWVAPCLDIKNIIFFVFIPVFSFLHLTLK